MVKRIIIWDIEAGKNRKAILKYWRDRTKSVTYSKMLNLLFSNSVKRLVDFPFSGKKFDESEIRYIFVKDYLIFYKFSDSQIIILKIWDGKQVQENLDI